MKPWWLRLVRYALPRRWGLALVALLMLATVGLEALKPWPLKLIVDCVLPGKPLPEGLAWLASLPGGRSGVGLLMALAAGTVLLFLAAQGARLAQSYVQSGVGSEMVYALGADLFDHLQRLSLRFHGQQQAGDLVRRVTSNTECVRELLLSVLVPMLTSLVSLATLFAIMWRLDRSLSLLALVVVLPLGVLIRVFAGPLTARTYAQHQREGELMAHAEQTLTAVPVVQAFGREEYGDQRFRALSRSALKAQLRTTLSQLHFRIGVDTAMALGTGAVTIMGGLHALHGTLSVGSILVFLYYLASLYAPLETLAYLSSGLASATAGARRVMEVLDAEDRVRETPHAKLLPARPPGARGHVRLERVTFGYESGRPVLTDISLEARPGETVALVGRTGSGKSTLVSLIPRLFDPWEGRVLLDGQDVREVQLASLRAHVAMVLQEPFLLPLSVAENIAYARPGASREDVVTAAMAANADSFIRRLPEGYDAVIGERGATLSGGEKQRLSIARALLKDAPILILDEPTAALDADSENLLLQALERLLAGRTAFIIAHRLSTIARADRIVMLDDGKVVAMGTHKALMADAGPYRRLYEAQFGPGGRSGSACA